MGSATAFTTALAGLAAPDAPVAPWPAPDGVAPLRHARRLRSRYLFRSAVRYGDAPQQLLDVWRRPDLSGGHAPVLVFVPGGGWLHGGRQLQGYSLMSHLAERGWVCVSVQYRVAPRHRWPRHIRDVRAAVAWVRAHIDQFGGDPRFVAVAGCAVYPEAGVDATGTPFTGASPEANVLGTVEGHAHVTAFELFGGDFHCGRPWSPFGAPYALPASCAPDEQGTAAVAERMTPSSQGCTIE